MHSLNYKTSKSDRYDYDQSLTLSQFYSGQKTVKCITNKPDGSHHKP